MSISIQLYNFRTSMGSKFFGASGVTGCAGLSCGSWAQLPVFGRDARVPL